MSRSRKQTVLVRRHTLIVRVTHWVNALALVFLLFSGLQIFNAHAALYWGKRSTFADPWISMRTEMVDGQPRGITRIGDLRFDTTGVLGRSKFDGQWQDRGFPAWLTLPPNRNLAYGRRWHFFFAWVFAVNGLIYLATGLIGRHLRRDVAPTRKDIATLHKDPHLRLKFSKGPESARYHQMQKIAYSSMVFVVLPVIALTGMTMSPGLNAVFPFLLDIFGGRQSARTIHFICMLLIVGFFFIHVLMVILSGPVNQVRGMITGRIAIVPEEEGKP